MNTLDRLLLGAILIVAVLWVVGVFLILVDFDAMASIARSLFGRTHFRVLA
jgi:hypothetical protein